MAGTIYLIDESNDRRRQVAGSLAGEAADLRTFQSAEDFLLQVGMDSEGCVVVPSDLSGSGALALIEMLRARRPTLRVVVLGFNAGLVAAVALLKAGAAEFVEAPVLSRRLRAAVRHALGERLG